MKELPIGFIDSGFGGLTVVKQSLKQLPNESILFIGDNARCPYGPRPLEEVKKYIWQLSNFLREKGIKMLVIACNTGTAAALEELKKTLPIPVVGVIAPGSRAAIIQTNNKKIGVIGTLGTIKSQIYENTITNKTNDVTVKGIACPSFVDMVETGQLYSGRAKDKVTQELSPILDEEIDTLVLGCTHYPLMRDLIQEVVGPKVHLIDSGVETINDVSMLLDYFNLSRTASDAAMQSPKHIFYTTGDADRFHRMASDWLNQDDLDIRKCEIKGEVIYETYYSES
ncbi:glutamate racemase [Facklamia miroungae]|uniref:Glutamate racemase n=1 Tax=Facklamia miroungae TaxID=120956 RepID=A0A1G7QZA3_9LACT|nr:glutamate racemase [Facklamia miroungae]NKZ29101.1 glutamate racemase [Facklamia miroungae]SDG03219.1 glutamate racemase [Facklamia miroungae]